MKKLALFLFVAVLLEASVIQSQSGRLRALGDEYERTYQRMVSLSHQAAAQETSLAAPPPAGCTVGTAVARMLGVRQ